MATINRQLVLEQIIKYMYWRMQGDKVVESLRKAGEDPRTGNSKVYYYVHRQTPKWVLAVLTEEQQGWLNKLKAGNVGVQTVKPFEFNPDEARRPTDE